MDAIGWFSLGLASGTLITLAVYAKALYSSVKPPKHPHEAKHPHEEYMNPVHDTRTMHD